MVIVRFNLTVIIAFQSVNEIKLDFEKVSKKDNYDITLLLQLF